MGHYNMADDWKTLRVPPGAYEQAKTQKEANDRTWGEQIVRSEDGEEEPTDENHEYDRWQLETENQQRLLEEHAKTQEILERLPQDIADELEGRFR